KCLDAKKDAEVTGGCALRVRCDLCVKKRRRRKYLRLCSSASLREKRRVYPLGVLRRSVVTPAGHSAAGSSSSSASSSSSGCIDSYRSAASGARHVITTRSSDALTPGTKSRTGGGASPRICGYWRASSSDSSFSSYTCSNGQRPVSIS